MATYPIAPIRSKIDREYLTREFNETLARHARLGNKKEVDLGIRRIAFEMGFHPDSVRRVLRDDLKLLPNLHHRKYTDEQYAEAKRLLETGMPYVEAGRLTGVSSKELGKKFPGKGLAPRDYGEYNEGKRLARELGLEV